MFIRHKLQKGFISRDQPPKEEEMTSMANCLSKLENYDEIEISIIRHTKINKVLKMIVKLNFVPRDEELQFRQRAMNILSKWKSLEPETATPTDDKEKEAEAKANGVSKEDGAETPSKTQPEAEKEGEGQKESTNEPLDDPMPDADAADKTKAPELVKEVEADVAKEGEVSETKAAEEKKTEAAAPEPAAEQKTSDDKEKPAEQQEQPTEQKEEGEKTEEKKTEEKTAEEATA